MLLLILLAVFFIALMVGVIGNIAGIGGGVIIVIFLVYLFRLSPLDAGGLSLLTIIFSTLSGFIQDIRNKLVDMRLLIVISAFAVTGSIAGSIATNYISSGAFKGIFSMIVVCIGFFSLYSSRKFVRRGLNDYNEVPKQSPDIPGLSLVAGVVSGFLGIGIGGIMGTYLTAIKRIKPKMAFSTIISSMLPVSIIGTSIHFYYTGFINIAYAPPLVVGALFGGFLGSWVISRSPQTSLRFFQGYIIVSFGILSFVLYLLTR